MTSILGTQSIQHPNGTAAATVSATGVFSSPGHVIQVVSVNVNAQENVSSSSYVASSGVTLQITPSSASSKILTICSPTLRIYENNSNDANMRFALSRDGGSTFLYEAVVRIYDYGGNGSLLDNATSKTILDTPNTTNTLTYTMYVKKLAGDNIEINPDGADRSTLTLMEIAG